ncbi:MAG: molybdate ABC transporter permease subunit [Tepidisphaeraceae bacterium]
MSALWPPLLSSLQVAVVATVGVALLAIPLAFAMARWRVPGRSVFEALLTVPLVLPPTVVGYFILMVAGRRSALGRWLDETFDYTIIFNWHGAVIASMAVALPMLYLPAKAAFAGVDHELEDASRLMGANLLQQFWHVSLPLARRGIVSGLLLAFARALGEFGATVMVLGDQERFRTLPISIYTDYVAGDLQHAIGAVIALTTISFVVILLYNRSPLDKRD